MSQQPFSSDNGFVTVGDVSTTGNIVGSNIGNASTYLYGDGSNITGLYGNTQVSDYLASGNITANIITTGNISGGNNIATTGNSYAQYFIGDGSLLTGIAPTVQVYEFANTISTGGYYEAVWLADYVAGNIANVVVASTTTPTLGAGFVTGPGYPNLTVIPSGTILVRIETTKDSGPNGYYVYAELYKRAAVGGAETLIATSDNSSTITQNNTVQQDLVAYITTPVSLLNTDQIVVKIYTVMASGSANITLSYDNNTGSGLQLPALPASAGQFVPYTGATGNVALGTYSLSAAQIGNASTYLYGDGSNITGISGGSYGNSNVSTYLASGTETANIVTTGNVAGGNIISTSNIRVGGQIQSTAFTGGNIFWTANSQTDFQGAIKVGTNIIKSGGGATSITLNNNGATIGILGVTNGINATSTTSGALTVTGGAGITGNVYVGRNLVVTPFVFSGLPATPAVGTRSFLTDANLVAAGNFGAQVSGGGSNAVPVWSDGTNWYIG